MFGEWWLAAAFAQGTPSLTVAERTLGDLEVRLLQGYPAPFDTRPARTFPLGLEFVNHGEGRTVRLSLPDGTDTALDLTAGQQLRWFSDLAATDEREPLLVRDGKTGASVRLYPAPTFAANAQIVAATLGNAPAMDDGAVLTLGRLDRHIPDTWSRLAGIDLIVVGTDPEWTAPGAHPAEWAVLREWILAGGLLLFVVPVDQPPPSVVGALTRSMAVPLATKGAWVVGAGRIGIWEIGADQSDRPISIAAVSNVLPFATRERLISAAEEIAKIPEQGTSALSSDVARSVADEMAPPFGLLGALLATYALLVGPIGWWTFIRHQQRPALYLAFTIGTSAVWSVGLVIADLSAKGLSARGIGAHLRIVDQVNEVEVDSGASVVFAPTVRGTALVDGWIATSDVAMFASDWSMPVHTGGGCDDSCTYAHDGTCDHGGACSPGTDCTDCGGVHTAPLWTRTTAMGGRAVSARITTTVTGSTVRPATGALLVTPRGSALIVENHLGLPLQDVVVWKAGQAYVVDMLGIGAQATAAPLGPKEAAARIPRPNDFLPDRLRVSYASLATSKRDRYVARGLPTSGFPRLLSGGYSPLVGATVNDRPVPEDGWFVVGLL